MLFNSLQFLVFFPTVVLLFFTLPRRLRWGLLVLASYVFYGAYDWHFVALLAGSTVVNQVFASAIDANEAQMIRVLGPHSRSGSPVAETHRGALHNIMPVQPVGLVVSIEETSDARTWDLLDVDDWMLLDAGATVARLPGGTRWAPLVRITYVPRANLEERILALLEMVGMDSTAGVASGGLTSRTMGSWSEDYGSGESSREAAKTAVLRRIHPTGGIVLR